MRRSLSLVLLLCACDRAAAPRDAALSLDASQEAAAAEAALDDGAPADALDAQPDRTPPELALPPSPRTLGELTGLSLPGRDLPTGADPASAARRAWALRAARALGVPRLRREFFWREVEPSQGDYRWGSYDNLVDECERQGLALLGVLAYGNRWASADPDANDFYPPSDPATFARYAGATAARYAGRVDDWEVWNEPNAGFRFWQPELQGDAVAFGRLVEAARAAVVRANPRARVAYGGTVFLPQVLTGGVDFARRSLRAVPGLSAALPAFAMHAYTLYPPSVSPETDSMAELAHPRKVERMAAMLRAEGWDTARPLWITEVGWPVTSTVTEELQARYLVRVVLLSALAGVDGVWLYELGDGPTTSDLVPEGSFGLYRYDADPTDAQEPEPKPSAAAVRTLLTLAGAWRVTGRASPAGAPSDAYVLTLERADGARGQVAWRADDRAEPWAWTLPAGTSARAMDGAALAGPAVPVGGAPVYALP